MKKRKKFLLNSEIMNVASDMLKINYLKCDKPIQMILREDLIGISSCFRFFYPVYESNGTLEAKGIICSSTLFSNIKLFLIVGIYDSIVSSGYSLSRMSNGFAAVNRFNVRLELED